MNIAQATTSSVAQQVGPTQLYTLTVRRCIRAIATMPFAVTACL